MSWIFKSLSEDLIWIQNALLIASKKIEVKQHCWTTHYNFLTTKTNKKPFQQLFGYNSKQTIGSASLNTDLALIY